MKPSRKKKDSVNIGGVSFAVEYVADLREDGVSLHGDTNVSKRTIRINSSDPVPFQNQTLFHEAIHAALYIAGQSEYLREEQEEGIVLAIEHLIWPLLPQLVKRANLG